MCEGRADEGNLLILVSKCESAYLSVIKQEINEYFVILSIEF